MPQTKSKQKKVSIILPNFNSYKYILFTIKSVLKQSYKNWELIIVDDCSNKKTRKRLLKYKKNKKIKIFWLKKNKGAGYCRNLAIKKAKGEFLAFIDSDDIWEKNKLQAQIYFMKKNKYDFSYTYYKTFNDGEKKFNKIITPKKFNFKSFTRNTSIATSTMIIKKKITDKIKFTNTAICEDYFYKCESLKKTKFAYCLNKFLTKYRIRNNSLQSSRIKNFFWIWKINKHYNKLNLIDNFFSLFYISINSIKKYGL